MKSYHAVVGTRVDGVDTDLNVNIRAEGQMDAMKQAVAWAERRYVRGILSITIARV